LKYVLQILWAVSNNKAEYEALLHGLRLAISLGIKRLLVYGDSLLVVQQVNKITVITDFPLADILYNQDATGRISKWAVELGALSIDFKPRTAIKSQALVNFMAK
jgi:ribonuclease HI